MYFVYIVRCRDDTLYTGITTDLRRRMRQHRGELPGGAKYTHARPAIALEVAWTAADRSSASKLEHALKCLPRAEKLTLLAEPERLGPEHPPLLQEALCAAWGT